MLNPKLRDEFFLNETQHRFSTAVPYRHVVIDDFLESGFAATLSATFPPLEQMKTKYNGINEKKAEHSDLSHLAPEFGQLKQAMFEPAFVRLVERISGINGLLTLEDRFGYGLHQGGTGSFLDIHIDYNLHPLKKKQRRLNLLVFLNTGWKEEWGGMLQLWNADASECVTAIAPLFNRCVLFECNDISYHGYNTIHCPPEITRKSFYTYFFSEPASALQFHDTVFKALPHESRWKKIIVTSKEGLKNSVKRMLYKTGLMNFLNK